MTYNSKFDRLNNVTVSSIKLKDGAVFINEDFRLLAWGDCCSRGWLSNLKHPPLPFVLYGTYIEGDNYIVQTDEPDFPKGGDYVVKNSIIMQTDKGPLRFYMWNDSNGYYGSTLHLDSITSEA